MTRTQQPLIRALAGSTRMQNTGHRNSRRKKAGSKEGRAGKEISSKSIGERTAEKMERKMQNGENQERRRSARS